MCFRLISASMWSKVRIVLAMTEVYNEVFRVRRLDIGLSKVLCMCELCG